MIKRGNLHRGRTVGQYENDPSTEPVPVGFIVGYTDQSYEFRIGNGVDRYEDLPQYLATTFATEDPNLIGPDS